MQELLFNALCRWPSVLVVYQRLWYAAQHPNALHNGQVAKSVGLSTSTVRHATRVLEKLGLVTPLQAQNGEAFHAFALHPVVESDPVWRALAIGEGAIDVARGTVTVQGSVFDRTPSSCRRGPRLAADAVGVFFVGTTHALVTRVTSTGVTTQEVTGAAIPVTTGPVTQELTPVTTQEKQPFEGGLGETFSRHGDTLDLFPELPAHPQNAAAPLPSRTSASGAAPTAEEVATVTWLWERWLDVMSYRGKGLRLGQARTKWVVGRLREGRTRAEFEEILQYAAQDSFLRGQNDRGRPFDDWDTLFQTPTKFDKWLKVARTRGRGHDWSALHRPDGPDHGGRRL